MSIFDVAVVDFVVQCPGRWAEWNGDHGKSAQPRANPHWTAAKTLARQEVMVPSLLEALNILYKSFTVLEEQQEAAFYLHMRSPLPRIGTRRH
jgi:hypothetical protein